MGKSILVIDDEMMILDAIKIIFEDMGYSVQTTTRSARSLVAGLDRNEGATVAVHGFVSPGTSVEICHVSHFITRTERFVTFSLDKAKGKIAEARSGATKKSASAH